MPLRLIAVTRFAETLLPGELRSSAIVYAFGESWLLFSPFFDLLYKYSKHSLERYRLRRRRRLTPNREVQPTPSGRQPKT